jgi:hypothetical protein
MRVIANRQLHGSYGDVVAGQGFECQDDIGRQLLRDGSVRLPEEPRILYDTKVIVPQAPEVSARQPFRDVPVHHEEPAAVAPEGDSVLSSAKLSEPRNVDRGGWSGRKGSGAGR